MTKPESSGGAKAPPRIFDPFTARKMREQRPGKGTGAIVSICGFDVDLHPFNTSEGEDFFELLGRTSAFQVAMQKGEVTSALLTELVSTEGPAITRLARSLVSRSLAVAPKDKDAFDEWFNELPLIDTLRALAPKVLEANGFAQMMRPTVAPPTESETESAETSTPTTQSVLS